MDWLPSNTMTQCPQVPLARMLLVLSPQLLSKLSRTSSEAAATTGLIGTAPVAQMLALDLLHVIATLAAPGSLELPPVLPFEVVFQFWTCPAPIVIVLVDAQTKVSNTTSFVAELTVVETRVVLPVAGTNVPKAVPAEVVSTPENDWTPTILPPVVEAAKFTRSVLAPVICVGFKR